MDNNILVHDNNPFEHELNTNGSQVKVRIAKTVNGMSAENFLKAAGEAGWPDAEKDDTLRAFTVMYDDNNQAMKNMAQKITNGDLSGYDNYDTLRSAVGIALLYVYEPLSRQNKLNNNYLVDSFQYLYQKYGVAYEQEKNPQPEQVQNENNNEIVNENVNENNNPNLLPIVDPNKQVLGHDWTSFHQALARKGWQNAENDEYIRGLFNLCNDATDRVNLKETADLLLKKPDNPEGNIRDDYFEHIRNGVASSILDKAKNHEPFTFDEQERPSVLFFQNELNSANLGYHYDFNQDSPAAQVVQEEVHQENELNNNNEVPVNNAEHPQPQEQPQEMQQNQNQNQVQQPQPQEMQQNQNQQPQNQPQPEPQPQLKTRNAWTNGVANTRAESVAHNLHQSTLTLRGSNEYKYVREEFNRVQERWKRATAGQNGVIDEKEIIGLRDNLMNVMTLADNYLDKKYREKDNSDNAKKRKIAVADSFNVLEEQLAIVNKRRDEIEKSDPPALATLATNSKVAMKKLDDATLHFRGSDEYKNAREAFNKASAKLEQLERKYEGQEGNISSDELEETRDLLMAADDKLALYSAYKDGNVLKDNTHDRLDAVNEGRAVILGGIRKLNALQAAKEAKPTQTFATLRNIVSDRHLDNFSNDNNVHFGSSEYEKAKQAYGDFLRKLNDGYGLGKTKPRDLDDLEKVMDDAEAKIDGYLARKREKIEWDEKGTARIAGMRASKESIIETRRAMKELINRRYAVANAMEPATLQQKEEEVLSEVKLAQKSVDGHSVWRGGKDYDAALNAYDKVCKNEKALDGNQNDPSRHALKAEIEELTKARDSILTYVRRKESEKAQLEEKGKSLDAIGAKRLEVMSKAYDNVRTRLDRAQSKMDELGEAAKKRESEQLHNLWNDRMADIPEAEGSNKIVAIKSANAIKTLERLSQQKKLTKIDQDLAQKTIAKLILSENIINGKFKELNPPTLKNFDTIAGKICESKDFTSAIPKEKLDPEACRNLLVGKKTLDGISKNVLNNMMKSGDKNRLRQLSTRTQMKQEENVKKHVNPLLS